MSIMSRPWSPFPPAPNPVRDHAGWVGDTPCETASRHDHRGQAGGQSAPCPVGGVRAAGRVRPARLVACEQRAECALTGWWRVSKGAECALPGLLVLQPNRLAAADG